MKKKLSTVKGRDAKSLSKDVEARRESKLMREKKSLSTSA